MTKRAGHEFSASSSASELDDLRALTASFTQWYRMFFTWMRRGREGNTELSLGTPPIKYLIIHGVYKGVKDLLSNERRNI